MAKEGIGTLKAVLVATLGSLLGGLGVYLVTRDKKKTK